MIKILLDTTYLLPIFGIGISLREYSKVFPALLDKYEVYYNPASIIEAKWVTIRLLKTYPNKKQRILSRFRLGLKVLLSSERIRQTELTNPKIEEVSDILLDIGLKDYFDRLIYATATTYKMILLTEDRVIHEIAQKKSIPKPPEVIRWENIVSTLVC